MKELVAQYNNMKDMHQNLNILIDRSIIANDNKKMNDISKGKG